MNSLILPSRQSQKGQMSTQYLAVLLCRNIIKLRIFSLFNRSPFHWVCFALKLSSDTHQHTPYFIFFTAFVIIKIIYLNTHEHYNIYIFCPFFNKNIKNCSFIISKVFVLYVFNSTQLKKLSFVLKKIRLY